MLAIVQNYSGTSIGGGHPQNNKKCPFNRGVPLIEVVDYKDYMNVHFVGKKSLRSLKGGVPSMVVSQSKYSTVYETGYRSSNNILNYLTLVRSNVTNV